MSYDKSITKKEIETIMRPKLEALMKQILPKSYDKNLDYLEKLILKTIAGNPFNYFTVLRNQITNKKSITDARFKIKLRTLITEGLIESVQCVNACTHKKAEFFPITEKGHDYLKLSKKYRIKSRLFKHTFYCWKVSQELKRQGHNPLFEEHRIDVSYRNEDNNLYAYEITLSFDNLLDNIKKCLNLNATLITIVTEDKADINKAREMSETLINGKTILEKVAYKRIGEFIPPQTKDKSKTKRKDTTHEVKP